MMRYQKVFGKIFFLFWFFWNSNVFSSIHNQISKDTFFVSNLIDSGKYYKNFQPDSALYFFEKAKKIALDNNFYDWLAQALYRIGEVHSDIGNYDTAIIYSQQALELYQNSNNKKGVAKVLTLLGIINSNKGNYLKAFDYYNHALNQYSQLNYYEGMASCYNNIGVIYLTKGMYKEAIQQFVMAIQLFEKSGNQLGMAKAYNNIGLVMNNQKMFKESLFYFQKAGEIFKNIKNIKGEIGIHINLGTVYKNLNDYNKAKSYYWQAFQLASEYGDKMGVSQSLNNLGTMEFEVSNYTQAKKLYLQSLSISRELEDKEGISSTMANLANLFLQEKNYSQALYYAQYALKIAQECGFLESQKTSYEYLANIYASMHQYDKAFKYFQLFKKYSDSTFNHELYNQINKIESKFQLERKQLEIENLQREKQLQKEKLNLQRKATQGLIIGIIITVILLLMVWYNYREKKKANVLLTAQNLEIQKKSNEILKQHKKIEEQHFLLKKKNENIIASISYAKHIQNTILPKVTEIEEIFKDSFILFKPKAIVSGDFYFVEETHNSYILAVVDCTGHGVPGALMATMGYVLLKQALVACNYQQPKEILNFLSKKVNETMNSSMINPKIKDTMDLSLCIIYKKYLLLEYAGVHSPVYIIRNHQLIELQPEMHCIGDPFNDDFTGYSQQQFFLQPNDALYLFSDGYVDQFGGDKGKKFMTKNFKELLLQNSSLPMQKQKEILVSTIENWKSGLQGNSEQIDDITILGIRI